MKKLLMIALLVGLASFSFASEGFVYLPGVNYNSEIPTLEDVVGHGWGEEILSYSEIVTYVKSLGEASSRVKVVPYAKTWEGRTLHYMVVASEANHARMDEIQEQMGKIAGVEVPAGEAQQMLENLPSIVWLAYGVHGNEISSPQAGLLTAYHLAAASDDEVVQKVLANSVVIIDPQQNPDGRDRFVQYFRQTRGRWADAHSNAAEHNETWPGGRSNHYLFDMNRDWFAMTQPETRGRVKSYLEWYPQVYVDLHEMGGNSTYYFAPPADPLNPLLTREQVDWLHRLGRNNAKWFDRFGLDYFTRETFDSFYPGYGEGWPMFNGSIGMTYEQASVRGMVLDRDDKTTIHYRDSVRNHFLASVSTVEAAADNRAELLKSFHEYRRSGVEASGDAPFQEYVFPPGRDPNRTRKLINLLMDQGIQVYQSGQGFTAEKVRSYADEEVKSVELPSGTFIVPVSQPSSRLAQTLLDKHTPMDEKFLEEQELRRQRRLRGQFYDMTGWSLPLIYDVEGYRSEDSSSVSRTLLEGHLAYEGGVHGGTARVAYLVPWGTNKAAELLAAAFREDIRVYSSDKAFTLNERTFGPGSLIIKVKDNPPDLHSRIEKLAADIGVNVYATDTGWVESGVNLGSNNVHYLPKPKIALAYSEPTSSSSVGATRYILEQMYGYPVTLLHTVRLGSARLADFNVLILPVSGRGGSLSQILGDRGVSSLKDWVSDGGTLVTFGGTTGWLTGEKVGLLPTKLEFKKSGDNPKKAEEEGGKDEAKKEDETVQPERERPDSIPGAIMRAVVDGEQWPGFGFDGEANVLVSGNRIFTPLKLDGGKNVVRYADSEDLVLSGFAWKESSAQLAGKAYLMHVTRGRGNIIAFAEDPNFRAFLDGLNMFLMNAVLLGPGH